MGSHFKAGEKRHIRYAPIGGHLEILTTNCLTFTIALIEIRNEILHAVHVQKKCKIFLGGVKKVKVL